MVVCLFTSAEYWKSEKLKRAKQEQGQKRSGTYAYSIRTSTSQDVLHGGDAARCGRALHFYVDIFRLHLGERRHLLELLHDFTIERNFVVETDL